MSGTCLRCGRPRHLVARKLCGACNVWARRNGTLDQYPRSKPPEVDREKVRTEYLRLRDEFTMAEIAEQLGVSRTTLYVVTAELRSTRRPTLDEAEVTRLRAMVGAA